ncbi:MAG: hypothetical protein ACREJ5_29400 [Geminicoccaceae bacterium]
MVSPFHRQAIPLDIADELPELVSLRGTVPPALQVQQVGHVWVFQDVMRPGDPDQAVAERLGNFDSIVKPDILAAALYRLPCLRSVHGLKGYGNIARISKRNVIDGNAG